MFVIDITSEKTLQWVEQPAPKPNPNQVLIQVHAAGINRPDLMQREGVYPPPAGASSVLGLEVAGIIVECGENVSHWQIGDKVCALVTGGGYAQYCVASAVCCLPIPKGLDFVQAAALPETFFTVWSNVFNRGKLQVGETLLVHGGSSGIGTTAIQLATAFGNPVFVTAGSDDKCRFCEQLGATAAINYAATDFVAVIGELTAQRGVDVILDMVGGDYLPRNLKCLAVEGRLLQIAIQQGAKAEVNLWQIMQKRLTLTGSTLRARDDEFKSHIAKQLRQRVWPLLASGQVKPVIHQVFPFCEAEAAHALMLSNRHLGKLVLSDQAYLT